MKYVIILVIIVLAVVVVDVLILIWFRRRIVKLSGQFVQYILGHIATHVKNLPKTQQIIEYDKILDNVLGELGYKGTLAEKMKQYQIKHPLSQTVWDAHKDRNKLVHEIGYQIPENTINRHVHSLEKEVFRILTKHT